MGKSKKSAMPFVFYSRLHLWELTGLRADTIPEMLHHIKSVPGSCIYHHTHHFLQQHQFSVPLATNDFAYWTTQVIGDDRIGEQLSSVDTIQATSIRELREQFIEVIEQELSLRPAIAHMRAPDGESFYFMKSRSFVFQTGQEANSLREFKNCLRRVSLTSIYYHIFESRLRFDRPMNDFSNWLIHSLGEYDLAERISKLEPYAYSLEGLRRKVIGLCSRRINELSVIGFAD